jgi:RNA polymerase sigma factor (sigma-70 family)
MAEHFLADALASVRRTLALATESPDDARLLARFAGDRDEVAFAELVARHGPAVWAACRRGSLNAADAEDVFQATFFVLARRAERVRRAASVGGWLFRVAVRLSARTRTRAARPVPDRPVPEPAADPADRTAWRDLVAVLDAEMAGLPEAVRAALVSCYYEGLTQDEAARRLGWKVRTVRARVARGRKLLRSRLARRGVDLGAALAATAIGIDARASLPQVSLTTTASGAVSPVISDLVGYGLALTGRSAKLPLAIAVAVVAAAGVGYVAVKDAGPAVGGDGRSVAIASPSGVPAPPADPRIAVDVVAIYNRAVDGCVYIVSASNGVATEGTGALIDQEQRLVLTTCRVVGDSDVVSVQFPYHNPDETIDTDRKEYALSAAAKLTPMGRVIHRDKARDLALVKLDRLGRHAHPLELAEPGVAKTVLHIGSGTGELFPMTVRTVTQENAPAITLSGTTDDSGGPLVDREGRLAGIVVGVATGPADQKVTLAVGTDEIRGFLADKDKEPPAPPAIPIRKDPPVDRTPKDFSPPVIPLPNDSDPPRVPIPDDFGPPVDPPPLPKEFDGSALYERCVRSTVFIVTPLKQGMAMGSGTLIDAEKRYVLTNYHVVDEVDQVFVQFPVWNKDGTLMTNKKKYIERIPAGAALKGKVLWRDKTRDLALIQLDKLPPGAKALPLAKKSVAIGEPVISIGNPGAVDWTFSTTQGNVRGIGVADWVVGVGEEVLRIKAWMITITNPINPGDSGGPLIDRHGWLVGVCESGRQGVQNVNNCVDIREVHGFLSEKKITIKDLTDEVAMPKGGLDSDKPRVVDSPAKKENGTESPPKRDSSADEKAATKMLQSARLFNDDDDKEYYKRKLKQVIEKYPDTAAGKEAKKLLDGLK